MNSSYCNTSFEEKVNKELCKYEVVWYTKEYVEDNVYTLVIFNSELETICSFSYTDLDEIDKDILQAQQDYPSLWFSCVA